MINEVVCSTCGKKHEITINNCLCGFEPKIELTHIYWGEDYIEAVCSFCKKRAQIELWNIFMHPDCEEFKRQFFEKEMKQYIDIVFDKEINRYVFMKDNVVIQDGHSRLLNKYEYHDINNAIDDLLFRWDEINYCYSLQNKRKEMNLERIENILAEGVGFEPT